MQGCMRFGAFREWRKSGVVSEEAAGMRNVRSTLASGPRLVPGDPCHLHVRGGQLLAHGLRNMIIAPESSRGDY